MRRPRSGSVARTLLVGGGALLVAAAALWVAFTAPRGIPGRHYERVTVRFADLANLPPRGADVRIAGRRVGQALDARLQDGRPAIDLQLDDGTEPLHADASARVRPRGLLGQQYVDLDPGDAPALLRAGASIPARRTSASVQLPDVLSALDARTRAATADTIDALGDGLLSRGEQLNDALRAGPQAFADLAATATEILRRGDAPTRLVRANARLAALTASVRDAIADGFDPEAAALRPLRVEGRAVGDILRQAPPALQTLTRELPAGDHLLRATRRFSLHTRAFTASAPAALTATARLLRSARAPLRATQPLLRDAARSVDPILRLTAATDPVLPRLRAALDDAAAPSRLLGERPCDLLRFWRNWESFLGNGIPGGDIGPLNTVRFEVIGGNQSIPNGATVIPGRVGRNPYPRPCQAGQEQLP